MITKNILTITGRSRFMIELNLNNGSNYIIIEIEKIASIQL